MLHINLYEQKLKNKLILLQFRISHVQQEVINTQFRKLNIQINKIYTKLRIL